MKYSPELSLNVPKDQLKGSFHGDIINSRILRIRFSTVPLMTYRVTYTGLFWPSLCTRSIACCSIASFHHVSIMKTSTMSVQLARRVYEPGKLTVGHCSRAQSACRPYHIALVTKSQRGTHKLRPTPPALSEMSKMRGSLLGFPNCSTVVALCA